MSWKKWHANMMSAGNKVHPVTLLCPVKYGYSQECSEDSILTLLMIWQNYFILKCIFSCVSSINRIGWIQKTEA